MNEAAVIEAAKTYRAAVAHYEAARKLVGEAYDHARRLEDMAREANNRVMAAQCALDAAVRPKESA